MLALARTDQADALRELLRKTELAGTPRRALLLHTDRLPPALGKPHHQRLARDSIASLASADRAQQFELSRGRLVVIWRHRGGNELETALAALSLLLADLPEGQIVPPGQIVSLYDLPEQGAWLLDELADESGPTLPGAVEATRPIDIAMLGRLEQTLSQADVSRFVRWRTVLRLADGAPVPAWEERYVAAHDVAATLCPDRRIKADPWLFRRLTRTFDRRMLAMVAGPQELRDSGPFALNLNVATILAPEFLRFDAVLPGTLRGAVTLNLIAADILADPATYTFARNFARSRGYRLLLRHASAALLSLFDVGAAELDYIQIDYTPEFAADPDSLRLLLPPTATPVLTGVATQAAMEWARAQRFALVRAE
ncbi:MAG TPA: hypothetical protein VMB71_09240 [Acetobacteraceae bacterium]|nr:hypothetical protein [Acetobacteraceae bacterium]